MSKALPGSSGGAEVVEEAARLLAVEISPERGAHRAGEHAAVSVDPRWNDDRTTIRLIVTCMAFGHRPARWAGLPIVVEPVEIGGTSRVAFLDARGHCVVPDLTAAGHSVFTSACHGASAGPVLRPGAPPAPGDHFSADGRLRASVRLTGSGDIELAIETADAALAQGRVRFAFVAESNRVEHEGEIAFTPIKRRKQDVWVARRVEATKVSAPCRLVFLVRR